MVARYESDWIERRGGWARAGLAAIAGLLAGIGFAVQTAMQVGWTTVPALAAVAALLAVVAGEDRPGRAARIAWAGGTGWLIAALHWIVEPFLVDAARHGWMAPFALVLLAGGMALYWAVAGWLAARLCRGAVPRLVAFAGLLSLAEFARGHLFTGFDWAQPGHLLIAAPWLDWAPLIGPTGMTLLVLGTAAAGAWTRFSTARWRAGVPAAALAVVLGVPLVTPEPPIHRDGPVVRVVQPNAPQHLKWHPDHRDTFIARAIELTATPAAGAPDLILWPEMAVTYALDWADPILSQAAAAAGGAPLLTGIPRRDAAGDPLNAAVLVDADGAVAAVYDKHHLVPFGEFLPLRGLMARLGIGAIAGAGASGYARGPGPQTIDIPGIGRAFVMICYEAIFPRHIRAVERPRVMVHLTNDAWFGTLSGPYQHLALARLRAAEQGIPVVRAANTGVSALIDGRGRVLEALPLGVAGHLDVRLPDALPPTLYARTGDWPALAAAALLALGAAGVGRRPIARGRARA